MQEKNKRRMCSRESFDPIEFKGKTTLPELSSAVAAFSSLPWDRPGDAAVSSFWDSHISTPAIWAVFSFLLAPRLVVHQKGQLFATW